MRRPAIIGIALVAFLAVTGVAQTGIPTPGFRTPSLSIVANLGYSLPLPPYAEPYVSGVTGDLRLAYRLPFHPRLQVFTQTTYTQQWIGMAASGLWVSIFTSTVDGGLGYTLLDPAGFNLTPYAFGGFGWGGLGLHTTYNTYQPEFGGGLAAEFRLNDRFGVYGDISYRWMRNLLSNGRFSVGVRYAPTFVALTEPGELFNFEYQPVFPVFYKYYESHPIASASLTNMGEQTISKLEIDFYIADYMSNPQRCQAPETLAPKEVAPVNVYALFSPDILSVSEGATVQAVFDVRYSVGGRLVSESLVQAIRVEDRNAMTWDDDARAASFVTALDQTVLTFAKNSLSSVDRVSGPLFNQNISRAIALYHALGLYGISYVPDPNTPHTEFAVTEGAIDFLQFPRQTLLYSAGDCDDLSILYCALLESVGTNTAFVTIPGHIFAAVEVGDTDQWRQIDSDPSEFIVQDDKVWLPVETTLLRQGFDTAWRAGAEQWRKYAATSQADLLPMHDSWATYEAVGFSSDVAQLTLPDRHMLRDLTATDVERIVKRQIQVDEGQLLARLERDPSDPAWLNRLGVLYARYGLADLAAEQLSKAVESTEYLPALVNLGNLSFVTNDFDSALVYYRRALALNSTSPAALLGAARCQYGLGKYDDAAGSYSELALVEPDLAQEYEYVAGGATSGARAVAADSQWSVPWVE